MNDSYLQTEKYLKLATILVALLSIWFLLITFVGYSQVTLDVPANTAVTLNGHLVKSNKLWLRSGSYVVATRSANHYATYDTLHVHLFLPATYKPTLKNRNPLSILTSALGGSGLYGKPTLAQPTWLENNSWLVGIVGPGSTSFIALHYLNGTWKAAYYDGDSTYPQDLASLPTDVSSAITRLQGVYSND